MTYVIYQLNEANKKLLFVRLGFLKKMGIEPTRESYDKVYGGEVAFNESTGNTLEDIYRVFNTNHPADFKGHSLSVSDIVELDGKYYYCDSFGFTNINF